MNIQGKIATDPSVNTAAEHVDVVGARISGIGAAYHLTKQNPDMRFLVLETQDSFGGTWHTHRYRGIRIVDCVVAADEIPNLPHIAAAMVGNYALAKIKEAVMAVTG
jgi:cation diffusion facilitator CzcD-associated flavoprotein CzcO